MTENDIALMQSLNHSSNEHKGRDLVFSLVLQLLLARLPTEDKRVFADALRAKVDAMQGHFADEPAPAMEEAMTLQAAVFLEALGEPLHR